MKFAYFDLHIFGEIDGVVYGQIQQPTGNAICAFRVKKEELPPSGSYQMLLYDDHFKLKDHFAEIRPIGYGSGIQVGCSFNDTIHSGENMIAYFAGLHRCRDDAGVGTWINIP